MDGRAITIPPLSEIDTRMDEVRAEWAALEVLRRAALKREQLRNTNVSHSRNLKQEDQNAKQSKL